MREVARRRFTGAGVVSALLYCVILCVALLARPAESFAHELPAITAPSKDQRRDTSRPAGTLPQSRPLPGNASQATAPLLEQLERLKQELSEAAKKNEELGGSLQDANTAAGRLRTQNETLTAENNKYKALQGQNGAAPDTGRWATANYLFKQHPIAVSSIFSGVLAALAILVSYRLYRKYSDDLAEIRRLNRENARTLSDLREAIEKPAEEKPSRTKRRVPAQAAGSSAQSEPQYLLKQRRVSEESERGERASGKQQRNPNAIVAQESAVSSPEDLSVPLPSPALGVASEQNASPVSVPAAVAPAAAPPDWRVRTGNVLRDYNAARAHEDAAWFYEQYRCTGLSCQNLPDLRMNPVAELRFEASGYGMFLGGTQDGEGFLLPSFDRDYAAARGSFEGVFDYPSASAGPFALMREARIARRGELWVLQQPGEMTLG